MKYDRSQGPNGGGSDPIVFYTKHLVHLFGRRIDLHKMVRADDPKKFHTHPAWAVRWILCGGYTEELEDGTWKVWKPGMIGIVRPNLSHRVDSLMNGRYSFSLWFRGRITTKVELRGEGWQEDQN